MIISLKKDTGNVILVVEDKGIGLSIVKAIVLQHSGSVRCESEQGNGSKFLVTLPSYDIKKIQAAPGLLS